MHAKESLILFLRNPVLGRVKTRLAKTLGEQSALAVYEQLLEITKRQLQNLEIPVRLYFDSIPDFVSPDWGKQTSVHLQSGNDLGERMQNAFLETFQNGAENVVIIGSDCPDLETKHIREAFSALRSKDAVIGPAQDGGYYLLALKTVYPEIFKNIPWSGDRVFAITLEKLQLFRKDVWILPLLNDIDEEIDLGPYLQSGKLVI
ncbi:TIGR04282 family arsenosugar biosynthesis glycosyltransferase [Leptospira stimsonii]|uniref:Glycosyltransferase n=1 Tax=Leptospira stimsonii TaxID=2202203 RepID=A0A4R9L9E2_9LEPT|nr:TIGR04282 family arsenosugar biosynthesis glycosyltransferase [Leptospira stimsonii]RHX86218.1 transferase 1, rSAM/selenodomain-associated protein [Leptospira stimsonii]TGK20364.1 glycosyltransferase [Leptospira stimsonii]TGM20414.1 glycosyltransferase [Leptospira stimsonii]